MEEQKQLQQTDIKSLTAEILILKQQTAQNIIEIGKRLIEVKKSLVHGEWLPWLEREVDFSKFTANRFMKVAEEFSNVATLLHLSSSKIFALLDIPMNERDDFMSQSHEINGQQKTVDEMSTRELQQAIKAKKEDSLEIEEVDEMKIIDIEIEKLKSFSLHSKYFKNMTGKEYIRFLESIQNEGIIEPILITQDYVIISGHQRVRACKDLDIKSISCRIKKYDDSKNETKQNAMLCDCLLSNLKLHSDDFDIARDALKANGWL